MHHHHQLSNECTFSSSSINFDPNKIQIDDLIKHQLPIRHSWYKIIPHNFENKNTVNMKIKQIRLRQLQMLIQQKVNHALLLKEYLVPL
jgi:hypothetical protein